MQKSERVAKNTGFLFVRMLITTAIGLFTIREVLYVLGVESYGVYNLVGTIVVMFGFLQFSLNEAVSRYITYELGAQETEKMKQTFSMSFYMEVILAVIIVIASEIVGFWFIEYKMNIPPERRVDALIVFQFSLITVVINLLKTPYSSVVIAYEKMDFFAYVSIIDSLLSLVIVYVLLIVEGNKLILYAILQSLVSFLNIFIYITYCKIRFPNIKLVKYWNVKLLRKLTSYSGWSMIVNLVDVGVSQATGIFFNLFGGLVANASYGIANQINSRVGMLLGNFSSSYYPQIIKSYAAQEIQYFYKLIYSSSKISFFLLFALLYPAMLNIEMVLNLWLVNPPSYAASFAYFIALYSLFDSYCTPLWQAVHATGNLKIHQIIMSSIKILNIPFSYLALKLGCPIVSVLIIFASLNFIASISRVYYMHYLIKLDLLKYSKEVFLPILIVVALSFPVPLIIRLCIGINLLSLMLSSIVFLFLYSIAIYFIGLNKREKEIIIGIAGNVIKKIKNIDYWRYC